MIVRGRDRPRATSVKSEVRDDTIVTISADAAAPARVLLFSLRSLIGLWCSGRTMLDTRVRRLQILTVVGTLLQLASSWSVFAPKPLSYATLASRRNEGRACFTGACRSSTRLRASSLIEDPFSPPDSTKPPLRRVVAVKRFTRLPFWPIWSGVGIWVLEKLGLKDLAAAVEDRIGGRVCPMIFLEGMQEATSPFIMNVHHHHSFSSLDPFRALQRLVFPEGFPSHPHAGFNTLTYVLSGRVCHRDSMGIKQVYGDGAVQYLRAGRGVLHEEMWELPGFSLGTDLELFQIWVNLPSEMKNLEPAIQLAGTGLPQALPEVVVPSDATGGPRSIVRVLMGTFDGVTSPVKPDTRLCVLHVSCTGPGAALHIPAEAGDSAILYMRKGRLEIKQSGRSPVIAEPFQTVFFQPEGQGNLDLRGMEGPADFLLLMGEPMREPVVAEGPFVFADREELERAYVRYQAGAYGRSWDHKLGDAEWKELCAKGTKGGDRRK